jgi:HSP20 family protein
MVFGKEAKNKPVTRVEETSGEITTRRPYDLWTEMDRMFDQFRHGFDGLFWHFGGKSYLPISPSNRAPPMDVSDLGDKYEMKVELPGISKDNIDIEVNKNSVNISAKHEEGKEEKDKNWLRRERSSTSFYRHLEFPEDLKTDTVEAEYRDGVLTLGLPKLEPKLGAKPVKVEVK